MDVDVLIVGDYCFDLILTGLPSEPKIGKEIFAQGVDVKIGGGTIPSGIAMKRLGLNPAIHMQLGNDFFSDYARKAIVDAGFDEELLTVHQQPLQRLTVALSYPKDRAFVSYADKPPTKATGNRFDAGILESVQIKHLHFAHLSAGLMAEELIQTAKRQGTTISSDSGWNPSAFDHPRLRQTLSHLDIFMPNEIEVTHIAGMTEVKDACRSLSEYVPLIVVKLGPKGSFAFTQEKSCVVPAIKVKAVETTSAGDCFNAGFLFGWLQGWSLEQALLSGNICGGLSATSISWQATPTREQLISLMGTYLNGQH
jgi:sugar/nucleoside kinase (ribokinase family)